MSNGARRRRRGRWRAPGRQTPITATSSWPWWRGWWRMPSDLKQRLEALRQRWHRSDLLGTDPLVLAYEVPLEDRETAAFLASCLAVGRASLVVQAGRDLLARVGSPLTNRLKERAPGTWHEVL